MFKNFFKIKIWVRILAIGVPLLILGYLVWIFLVTPRHWCGTDVKRIDGQCIGVTDGSTELSAELADVLDKIRQENEHVERVLSEDPTIQAVSIAHLIPLPKPSTEDELTVLLRHELEGVHLAQLRANRTETLGGQPLIRLLVANSGENSDQRQEVTPALLAKVSGPERLVTVVVTGRSLSETIDSIDTLRAAGVPVVASRLAGDRLTNLKSEEEEVANLRGGLARIASPASDQAAATAAYLKPTASRVLIIRDMNPSDIWLKSIPDVTARI